MLKSTVRVVNLIKNPNVSSRPSLEVFVSNYTPGILYAEGVYSFCQFHFSVLPSFLCLSVILSINPFYNQVLLLTFLISYNSAATDQKLFIFGIGVPGRILLHSTSMDPWIMPQGRARGQNLGCPN